MTYEHKLGEGATAVVWKGSYFRFTGDGYEPPLPVAIKEIRSGLQMDTARAVLRNEAVALGALGAVPAGATAHVVQLIDSVDAAPEVGGPALVFELIPGETLEARLRRQLWAASRTGQAPGMPSAVAWNVFAQLTAALGAVHASGQVHADVTPANAMLRPDGALKLTDFGLARPAGARVRADEAGAGTSAYISPEQALGQPLGPASDLYSAATVLFEMLAGRTPFDLQGRNELAVRMDQIHRQPPRLSSFVPGVAPHLDHLLHVALAKAPHQRFQSAADMHAAFAGIFRER